MTRYRRPGGQSFFAQLHQTKGIQSEKLRHGGIMKPFRLAVILLATSLSAYAQQTPVIEHPEIIEGRWETTNSSGIDGILFTIETSHVRTGRTIQRGGQTIQNGPPGAGIARQTVEIQVYHRQSGKEAKGYFSPHPPEGAIPTGSFSSFDGEHLRIHFTGDAPFDLDATFSAAEQRWTGTWSRVGEPAPVVLERPHLGEGAAASAFVGDWEGQADPNERGATSGTLHVRQSRDGALTAWLDRGVGRGLDQRNGEPLTITTDQTAIKLDLDTVVCCAAPFNGVLSDDHQTITGVWFAPGMPGLQAPKRFRRMSSGAL
jgi:hypothetical protein